MFGYHSPADTATVAPTRERRPTPDVKVEPCTRSGLKEVLALVESSLKAQHPRISDWIKEHRGEFCKPIRPIWVAMQDGELAGVLIARMDETKDAKCSILFVREDSKRDLLRTELLRKFEQSASLLGKSTVHVLIYADEENEIAFFRSHGYQVANPELYNPAENPGRIRVLMVKRPLLRT